MANTSGSVAPTDLLSDLLTRYGKQALQVFAALAGATGLFYAIGFIIVNTSLLKLGVLYESALVSAGYVAPGISFVVIFALSAGGTIAVVAALRRTARTRLGGIITILLTTLTVVAGSLLFGWVVWFFRSLALGVVVWAIVTDLGAAIMAYAEHLPLVSRLFVTLVDHDNNPLTPMQARLSSTRFIATAGILTFFSVLLYGYLAYEQVPPALGGGLPSVVRFFGADVSELGLIGIDLEPGRTNLTERVELITQTEDRYIARVGNHAVSFDKSFVQGISYELPEFYLDPAYYLETHTRLGRSYFNDGRYDEALSEFDLVLGRQSAHAPALHGRIDVLLLENHLDLDRVFEDYRTLTRVESRNADNFYGFAAIHARRSDAQGQPPDANEVVEALQRAWTLDSALIERARDDAVFDSLRGDATFDVAVYESGSAAARWFRDRAQASLDSGAAEEAISAYRRAIDYAERYSGEEGALDAIEIADLRLALGGLYDPFSEEALNEYRAAAERAGGDHPEYLIRLADLHLTRGDTISALATYDQVLNLLTEDDPDRLQALIGQGQAALEAQEYVLARAAFEQALTLSGFDASTRYDYARVLAALNDEGTEQALREAFALDPSLAETAQAEGTFSNAGTAVVNLIDGVVYVRQARSAREQGDLDTAIAAFQNATSADPNEPLYWVELGEVLAESGRYAEAAPAYQNALALYAAPDTELLKALGNVQLAAGDLTGAIDSFTQAIIAWGDAAPAENFALLGSAQEAAQAYNEAAAAYGEAEFRDLLSDLYPYRRGINLLLADRSAEGLEALDRTFTQGWLRVESSEASLRNAAGTEGVVLKTLSVGAVLSITGEPQVLESQVWWEVADQDETPGWVNARDVVPSVAP